MFVTKSQIFIATFLFGAGFFSGAIFNILYFFINKISCKILRFIFQFLPCILLAFIYCFCYFWARLPDFAPYMPVVFLIGCLVERKTLHLPLANCLKKLYYSIIKRDKR